MVVKEWNELISEIRLEKQCKGLIYEDFELLMLKYGFAKPDQNKFLSKVFFSRKWIS